MRRSKMVRLFTYCLRRIRKRPLDWKKKVWGLQVLDLLMLKADWFFGVDKLDGSM